MRPFSAVHSQRRLARDTVQNGTLLVCTGVIFWWSGRDSGVNVTGLVPSEQWLQLPLGL